MRRGLSPAASQGVDTLSARAFTHLDARLMRAHPAPVALALSGGGDSLALLLLAAAWCAHAGRPLLALTVDHRLAPASAAWTAFAGERARAAGAAWRALPWLGPRHAGGLPAAARKARHALLADAARAAGARVVLLGHTADDVIEGERMRAADAPGLGRLRVWGPSPAWPQSRGTALLRPLLDVGRTELREWLHARGEACWIDDPANDDLRSPRTRARRDRRPAPPAPETADPPRDCAALAAIAIADAAGRLAWPLEALRDAPDARTRVLAAAAVCVGGGVRPPRSERARAFAEAATGEGVVRTLAGARLSTLDDEVALTRAPAREPPSAVASPHGETVWDGRFQLAPLRSGWRVAPLAGHAARLAPGSRRALATIPAAARPMLPVLLGPDGAPHLPRPLGDGPGEALSLVGARLHLTLGALRTEAELAREATCTPDASAYPPLTPPCR